MTLGRWTCIHCGNEVSDIEVSSVVDKCDKCKASYSVIKWIKPHVAHKIAITRSDKGFLNCVVPVIFAIHPSRNKEVKLYFDLVKKVNQRKRIKRLKGLKTLV